MNDNPDRRPIPLVELELARQFRQTLYILGAAVLMGTVALLVSAVNGSLVGDRGTVSLIVMVIVLGAVVVFFTRRLPRGSFGCRDPETGRRGALLSTVTVRGDGVPNSGRFRCEAGAVSSVADGVGGREAAVIAWDGGGTEAVDLETFGAFEALDRGRWPSKDDRERYALERWQRQSSVLPGSGVDEPRTNTSILVNYLIGYAAFFALAVFVLWLFIRSGRISSVTGRAHAWDDPYSWFAALGFPVGVAMWQLGRWTLKRLGGASKRS